MISRRVTLDSLVLWKPWIGAQSVAEAVAGFGWNQAEI